MQLFYSPGIKETDTEFQFDKEESQHIVKVLRKGVADRLYITDGEGMRYQVEITEANAKTCTVNILDRIRTYPDRHHLHMVVAPTKMNDRYEWFLEKATEIGVHEITPIICERSERKTLKMDRLERVVEAAMKQSLQTYKPKLNTPVSFEKFIALPPRGLPFIAHCEPWERYELKRRVIADKDLTLLIGPEGDFTPAEIKKALETGYTPVSLGKNRLRTETAAIVACATVALINNS
jgi:16S rRNA (uracil1498-N3)-methyltransferase